MNTLKLNGQPVAGRAILETLRPGGQRIWAAITVAADSPVYRTAKEAVFANDLTVTLQGEAHEPLKGVRDRLGGGSHRGDRQAAGPEVTRLDDPNALEPKDLATAETDLC